MTNGSDASGGSALIGYSGFIGSSLLRQRGFDRLYRSTDIGDIAGRKFDHVVCAGAPGWKWRANRDPAADRRSIEILIAALRGVRCRTFVLISTVDVFADPVGVDEGSPVCEAGLPPYGVHRRRLERFVEASFPQHVIVRLPAVVGPGLRKNAIFDLRNDHNLEAIDARSVFQFYPAVNLWSDIERAVAAGLPLVHLAAEPIAIGEVAQHCFGKTLSVRTDVAPVRYDMRSRYAELLGGSGHYVYGARESLLAIRAYAQTEPATVGAGQA